MKIYTKTGDKGQTSLANGMRVRKTDARIDTYGTADELNSFVGLLRVALSSCPEKDAQLVWLQNRLFDLGACLAEATMDTDWENAISKVEGWIDAMQTELEPLRAFVLPAGNEAACRCHVCRTVARRLERKMIALTDEHEETKMNPLYVAFVNRLSDYFFVLARYCMHIAGEKEHIWQK